MGTWDEGIGTAATRQAGDSKVLSFYFYFEKKKRVLVVREETGPGDDVCLVIWV
jgi:hypothetical protein